MNLSTIDIIFFIYMFIGLYMISLFLIIYIPNRKKMFDHAKGKPEPISIVVPCYNEGENIGKTIQSLLNLNYPKKMIEIIVVDDCSTDNSVEIAKKYSKKYKNIKVIVNKRNSGGAAEPTNIGVKAAKYKYIAVTDADSYPEKDSLIKMIGFLQEDETVGAVTCSILAKNPKKFIQRLQAIEYVVIAFGRKLLDFIDAVYVAPGPLALYRKDLLIKVGLFDTKNLTQDIEIIWRLLSHGYKTRIALSAKVYSETPTKFKIWWKQRIRWTIGGTQCILKYKTLFLKRGMLGLFIIPFFTLSLFLGLFGLSLFTYLISRRFLLTYLTTKYSIYAQTAILRFEDLTFTPSVLNFFGAALFFVGLGFTILTIFVMNEKGVKNKNIPRTLFYQLIYLMIYPIILIAALWKLMRGKYSW